MLDAQLLRVIRDLPHLYRGLSHVNLMRHVSILVHHHSIVWTHVGARGLTMLKVVCIDGLLLREGNLWCVTVGLGVSVVEGALRVVNHLGHRLRALCLVEEAETSVGFGVVG
jgi:hypothetical protein